MSDTSPDDKHARKAALIAGIAAGKTVIVAADEAGIGWRRAYVWRAEDAAFRAAWDQARAQIRARVPAVIPVPASPDPPTPLPAFAVPPSPPLPARPAKAEKPKVQVIIDTLDDDDIDLSDVVYSLRRDKKQSDPPPDDNGPY